PTARERNFLYVGAIEPAARPPCPATRRSWSDTRAEATPPTRAHRCTGRSQRSMFAKGLDLATLLTPTRPVGKLRLLTVVTSRTTPTTAPSTSTPGARHAKLFTHSSGDARRHRRALRPHPRRRRHRRPRLEQRRRRVRELLVALRRTQRDHLRGLRRRLQRGRPGPDRADL